MELPFNISAMSEATEFKICMRLAFCKAPDKTTPKYKSEPGYIGELPKIGPLFFNMSGMALAGDFKFSTQLVFAMANHKITSNDKSEHRPGPGELHEICGSPIIFLQWLKLRWLFLATSRYTEKPQI